MHNLLNENIIFVSRHFNVILTWLKYYIFNICYRLVTPVCYK